MDRTGLAEAQDIAPGTNDSQARSLALHDQEARLLTIFEISSDAEGVWRSLLLDPAADPDALVARFSGSRARLDRAIDELLELELVRPDRGRKIGIAAVDPALAIDAQIARVDRQLAERREELVRARSIVPTLARTYAKARAAEGAVAGVEVIVEVDDVRRQIAIAAEREKYESRYLGDRLTLEGLQASHPIDAKSLARGVRQRSLLAVAALDDPLIYAEYQMRAAWGEQVRVTNSAQGQMLIFDDDLAVLHVDPRQPELGAMFIRIKGVVAALVQLFDQLWQSADPMFGSPEDASAPSGRLARVLELIATGVKDERIARALGVGARTVRRDIAELKSSLNVSSRAEIVAAAIRRGWL